MRHSVLKERWLYPLTGGVLGLVYVIVDEGVLDWMATPNSLINIIHEFMDAVLPVLLGISIGFGFAAFKRLSRLNSRLSLKTQTLEKDLLYNTLISQMLHEIQNPIHNISAVFEDADSGLTEEKLGIVRRNLARLTELKKQYGEREGYLDAIDNEESISLKEWVAALIEDKLGAQLHRENIRLHDKIAPMHVRVSPLVLEQIMTTILSNALEALKNSPPENRDIFITAVQPAPDARLITIQVSNGWGSFPDSVTLSQGRRLSPSKHGLGLGLVLLNRMIEQIGGTIRLENLPKGAQVTLTLPGGTS